MKKTFFTILSVVALIAGAMGFADARSSYQTSFNTKYGASGTVLNNCIVCHTSSSGGSRNSFGNNYASSSIGNHTFNAALEGRDSDGDGYSNITEINARTFPGNANSRPTGTPPPPVACTYTYSAWGACRSDDTQTRTVTSTSPAGCTGTPVTSQSCNYVPPPPDACTYTYSAWGACRPDGTQTRTVTSTSPAGCTGSPVTSQSCNYVPPPPPPSSGGHDSMIWTGSSTCLVCHSNEANQVHASVHYQWKGSAEELVNGQPVQGKTAGAMNSYCVNILGNWNACSTCHVGLGAVPEETATMGQLNNIDCLICHQKEYKRIKVNGTFVPDTANMAISMDKAARTVHRPTRDVCLQCHAKGGGGDNNKRGDMPLALGNTKDRNLDVHMATTGNNFTCQECHTTSEHKMAGRGNDLRPVDLNTPMGCITTNCHANFRHSDSRITKHTAKVACQTCHIKTFARNAVDTTATEATEMHRDWRSSHLAPDGKMHPAYTMVNNVKPVYRFWNGQSSGYTIGDTATIDPKMRTYLMSKPEGGINDPESKLYPFKYKTSKAPIASRLSKLIALDTAVYFTSGDVNAATRSGLQRMGLNPNEPYAFVTTGEFQLITHEVPPKGQALRCSNCHGTTAQMNLKAIGYGLKASQRQLCTSCHGQKENKSFTELHKKHVTDKRIDCSRCHTFTRAASILRASSSSEEDDDDDERDDR